MKSQLLVLIAVILLGVGGAQAMPIAYTAELSGANENPTNASPATGFTTVTIDIIAHTLLVEVSFSGLTAGNSAAHIHCCTAPPLNIGVATTTPTFTGFPTGTTSGSYLHLFDLTLASSFNAPFVAANGGTLAGAEAALAAGLDAGHAYLNIHSTAFPAGEIRGFLTPVPEPAPLSLLSLGIVALMAAKLKQRARIS